MDYHTSFDIEIAEMKLYLENLERQREMELIKLRGKTWSSLFPNSPRSGEFLFTKSQESDSSTTLTLKRAETEEVVIRVARIKTRFGTYDFKFYLNLEPMSIMYLKQTTTNLFGRPAPAYLTKKDLNFILDNMGEILATLEDDYHRELCESSEERKITFHRNVSAHFSSEQGLFSLPLHACHTIQTFALFFGDHLDFVLTLLCDFEEMCIKEGFWSDQGVLNKWSM